MACTDGYSASLLTGLRQENPSRLIKAEFFVNVITGRELWWIVCMQMIAF